MLLTEFLTSFGNFVLALVVVFLVLSLVRTLVVPSGKKAPWLYLAFENVALYGWIIGSFVIAIIFAFKFIAL